MEPASHGASRSRADPSRFVARLDQRLLEHHHRAVANGSFLTDVEIALPAAARPIVRSLATSNRLHRFFGHIRSSQQFAVALFGGLPGDALLTIARLIEPAITGISAVELEYVDQSDRLGERRTASPHATQADVAIRATLGDGRRHLALVEVKLSEHDFGHCTGYQDPANDRADGCRRSDAVASGPTSCFKLANHNRGGERAYHQYVSALHTAASAGCPFRTSNNQPMRYVALAQSHVDAGEFDSASVTLCAHDGHRTIWRRWEEFKAVATARDVRLGDLPASQILAETPADDAQRLSARYGLVSHMS